MCPTGALLRLWGAFFSAIMAKTRAMPGCCIWGVLFVTRGVLSPRVRGSVAPSLTASATAGWRLGFSVLSMPAVAWKYEIAARACWMVLIVFPVRGQVAKVESDGLRS